MHVFGLLGNPVEHSLSPPMHEAAYAERDLDARYVTFEPTTETLPQALDGADALNIRGLNVTIPFKQQAHDLVEPDDLAARIGAVNTLDFSGETVTGHNTDAAGAVRALGHHDVDLSGTAVVVGAGGAGRAVAFGLADAGMNVEIANRTVETARELAAEIPRASGHGLPDLPRLIEEASVLVNCTSVGMDDREQTIVPGDALHADLAVLDAVYTPLDTRLLREADAAGATTVDGAWMLLFQGVEAFELWTGEDAPVDAMNRALRDRL
ncbi:shikimate dehydrogenase [Halosegnis longus]|uniref:Shikimate dehydrogenase (NADP(+)) n=1 Tax=Halosegnis longus TaxID=2216012 RepID=A0AAJ4R7W9_9EURY|nr:MULTISPECIES: shikimate dehydrogenase [Halobacteriales]RNJ25826.1 shikimate dehydrogenase [Salella cibi]